MIRLLALFAALICVAPAVAQQLPAGADPQNTLLIDTKYGRIVIKLRHDLAPKHVERIKLLAREKLLRQRAVPPRHRGLHGADRRRPARRRHRRIEISRTCRPSSPRCRSSAASSAWRAAQRSEFRELASSSSCIADGSFLNGKYTVVGEVLSGMDVVDKIKKGEPVVDPDRMTRVQVAADAK